MKIAAFRSDRKNRLWYHDEHCFSSLYMTRDDFAHIERLVRKLNHNDKMLLLNQLEIQLRKESSSKPGPIERTWGAMAEHADVLDDIVAEAMEDRKKPFRTSE